MHNHGVGGDESARAWNFLSNWDNKRVILSICLFFPFSRSLSRGVCSCA